MDKIMKYLIAIAACLLVAIAIFVYSKPKLYLVADGVVPVYGTLNDAMTLPPSEAVFRMAPSERALVAECIDVKHYYVYKVLMDGDRQGVANAGEYHIEREDGSPGWC